MKNKIHRPRHKQHQNWSLKNAILCGLDGTGSGYDSVQARKMRLSSAVDYHAVKENPDACD